MYPALTRMLGSYAIFIGRIKWQNMFETFSGMNVNDTFLSVYEVLINLKINH